MIKRLWIWTLLVPNLIWLKKALSHVIDDQGIIVTTMHWAFGPWALMYGWIRNLNLWLDIHVTDSNKAHLKPPKKLLVEWSNYLMASENCPKTDTESSFQTKFSPVLMQWSISVFLEWQPCHSPVMIILERQPLK